MNISPVALGLGLQPFLHSLHVIFISQTEKGDGEQRFSIAEAAGRAVTSPPRASRVSLPLAVDEGPLDL